ncbi:MAG: response regulator [Erysipelotrichia bacterium]|nr:response regulator [Erysipelotrichia bacterium]
MKKIALIEDRDTRQERFSQEENFDFETYRSILDNFVFEEFEELALQILNDSFNLLQYDVIICHKSVQIVDKNDSNLVITSRLKDYCKKHQKTLILFSGGISANYYDNSEYDYLELNSKTFYSQNLKLFLDEVQKENENILMLCYGEHWQENIVANILEKTNLFIFDLQNNAVDVDKFEIDADLVKIDHDFYTLKVKTLDEILLFKESLEKFFTCKKSKKTKNISLIIHNDNVCDPQLFDHHIKFSQTFDEIDMYISNIIDEVALYMPDMIFIKDNLSKNYFELLGLRLAHHIRLSSQLGEKSFVPIVIISDFGIEALIKFNPLANILTTDNVFVIQNTTEEISQYQTLEYPSIKLQEYVESIVIYPPKDYLDHHSIANEWSIYRWAEFLRVESKATIANRVKVENMLYFKYLKAKYATKDESVVKTINPLTKKGKVLLIDDEWSKGWSDILNVALKKDGVEFKTFEYEYKDKSEFNLIVQLKHKELTSLIEKADVIILDLRLLESDHKNEKIENYTGIKILEKIHEINAGIQVIMLTATSKSTILEKLYEKKILGYIKKEHPDDINIDTVENINKLLRLVDKGLQRKYLKEVWEIQNDILVLKLLSNLKLSFDMDDSQKKLLELKNTVTKIFETLDSNIPKPFIYGMLTLYKCIEIINDYYIYEKYDRTIKKPKAYWVHNNKLIDNDGNSSVNNKIKSILKHLEIQNDERNRLINEISCTRNYEIHSGEIKSECEGRIIKNINEQGRRFSTS